MQKEKVRIFALARELDMESKDLLTICRQNGIDVKNQLSTIEPELGDQIRQMVKKGGGVATAAPSKPVLPLPEKKIVNLDSQRKRPAVLPQKGPARAPEGTPSTQVPAAELEYASPSGEGQPGEVAEEQPAHVPETGTPGHPEAAVSPRVAELPPSLIKPELGHDLSGKVPSLNKGKPAVLPPAGSKIPPAARPSQPESTTPAAKVPTTPPTTPPVSTPPGQAPRPAGGSTGTNVPNLTTGPRPPSPGGPRTGSSIRPGGMRQPPGLHRPHRPTGGSKPMVPNPPKFIKQEDKKPQLGPGVKKLGDIPTDMMQGGPVDINKVIKRHEEVARGLTVGTPASEVVVDDDDLEEGKDRKKGGGSAKRPVEVAGRDARHKERAARQEKRKQHGDVALKVKSSTDLLDEDEPRIRVRPDRIKKLKKQQLPTEKRKGRVPIDFPITVRSLCEAIGIRSAQLLLKLMGRMENVTINSILDPEVADELALENGVELEIKKGIDLEEQALTAAQKLDDPADLKPRAPIVTIMGHVDHGKTSLLDKIRHTNVTATEAGGITQVIRAWRVEHNGHPITFLDTPGHEAFTKMRARGANVTDIAVIVVAADDGVMPQTEEAINHAKAAGVATIVAINKVDLPNANLNKTQQQLYGLEVLPDNMGGDTPFVQTSAVTGKGIDDLLEAISIVAEVHELKANPNRPGSGTCLEAYKSEEEGVLATLLVRNGTLRRGDVILCGAAYGRVRAMYDDLGRPIEDAGPSVPVRVAGLDVVPNADDPFLVVDDLAHAGMIADKRKKRMQIASLTGRTPISLETLSQAKIAELKVILKAEARGSIEAIRKELEKLHHAEVRVRILEAAIGGITENDVWLALTSPEDTLILGFNVVPDERAQALAEERGVQIKQYNIIYNLTDDVRSALEGKLKPREEVVHLGRAVVRETFKISRVGTIAGCRATSGVIERSAKVRVIRNGVVVYPPADRTVGLESLKRFKEDVREVREGFECGIKIAGYDDIKVDDVIEAYRIDQVQRTLS